jgi:hypothetical protein
MEVNRERGRGRQRQRTFRHFEGSSNDGFACFINTELHALVGGGAVEGGIHALVKSCEESESEFAGGMESVLRVDSGPST